MIRTAPYSVVTLLAALLLFQAGATLFADEGMEVDSPGTDSAGVQIIPLAHYQRLSLASQTVHSPGAGVVVGGENLLLVGLYSRHVFERSPAFSYPDTYHSIQLMVDGAHARHRYLGFFKSESDRPVIGGLQTFQMAAVYGYEVVQLPRFSLVLGGGLAVNDFGIETAGGDPWPLLPVPLVRAAWESRLLKANLDFITGPNVHLTLVPQSRLHATLDARVDQLRDERDLIFEGALVYRLFAPDHRFGMLSDLAYLAVGIKSDVHEFNLGAGTKAGTGSGDESLELHYYALFGRIDLTLVTVSGGYAFDSRVRYRESVSESSGEGWFISVSALVPLGGARDER